MITKSQAKRKQDIKTKLMAAIAMLLVSSIMMVSSTYAWFTLSTAPEVTGITTAVGANGNLEMALLPKDGLTSNITSQAGDSNKDIEAKNVTWGNLVDLSDTNVYGLDKITLFPAELNITGNTIGDIMLKTPTYGADGRVNTLNPNTVNSYYDGEAFNPNDYYGVRAVGVASGMTERELSYRNARSNASTFKSQAANYASSSLNANGSALANIAIEYGMGADTASFDKTDVASLRAIIGDLKNEILPRIEKAYMQYILAYAASAASGDADTVWTAIKGTVEANGATLDSVVNALSTNGASLPDGLNTAVADYNNMVSDVTEADTALKTLEAELATDDSATFTWEEIKSAMSPLADPSAMIINGYKASEVKNNLGDLVSSVTSQGGLKVYMQTDHTTTPKTSAGVYADIADHCGDYEASVTIEKVEYNGITLNNMAAKMLTDSALAPNYYLANIGNIVSAAGAPKRADGQEMPISDMYGYVIDLAFRTNATDSKLLLQREATDRIYSDNTNEETMGHGSTMTFKSTTTDFSNDQVKALMGAIRIVFFDPAENDVYCYGKLDVANATSGTDGWTAEIVTYKNVAGEDSYSAATYAENSGLTYYTKSTKEVYTETTYTEGAQGTFCTKEEDGTYTTIAQPVVGQQYWLETTEDVYTAVDDATAKDAAPGTLYTKNAAYVTENPTNDEIMSLTQNTAHALSVLVYLDGNVVTNSMVAATAATSMTGKMNLQFASTANLTPMEYKDLHIEGSGTTTGGTTGNTETVNVTVPTGVTGNATATKGQDYTFTYTGNDTVGITVGGQAITTPTPSEGSYTIPAASVTGDIVITLTPATP